MTRDLGTAIANNFGRMTSRRAILKRGVELGAVAAAVGTGVSLAGATGAGGAPSSTSSSPMMLQGHDDGALVPGVRPDGTRLWRVQVGGMDMEAGVDFQGFFPGEITINAGDSIWFD